MLPASIVAAVIVAIFVIEYYWHRKSRDTIPIRIHVNGIRGKSSVVRLIAAGLRQGGIPTWAKVTGTLPSIITGDGEDVPIVRGSPATIIEQRAVIAAAAGGGAQALVLECMALEPAFQRAEENLFRPTIGVVTNIRLDHEEVFGSSLLDVALALSSTAPRGGVLVTTAGAGVPVLRSAAERRSSGMVIVDADTFPDSLVDGLSYVEHKENVALALAVCEEAGVPRELALAGMRECQGDPGALRVLSLTEDNKTLVFVNALAANDPESTMLVFERTVAGDTQARSLLVLVNSRTDRPLRSKQLGRLLIELPATRYFLMGSDSDSVRAEALRAGVSPGAIHIMDGHSPEQVVADIFASVDNSATLFAIGNTAGLGLLVADYFAQRGRPLPPESVRRAPAP